MAFGAGATLFLLLAIFGNRFGVRTAVAMLDIGVNYGLLGNNLLPHADVIALYKKYNIGKLRLFDPVPEALEALRGSSIVVTLGVRNQDLPALTVSMEATKVWFDTHVQPYINDIEFSYIAVGNEVIPGEFDRYVLPVMQNFQSVLNGYNYAGIKATTVISMATLGTSFPPSAGAFADSVHEPMLGIVRFLSENSSPLLINVYPCFAYAGDPVNVPLDYALFTATEPVLMDHGLSYWNLLDAMVDAVYSAMEKLGVSNVDLVVSESGWPSAGNGKFTTPELAKIYNQNFVKKFLARTGTPKRPDRHIEGFIFAMFNENLKPEGVERNFGLFYPNGDPVYPIFT